MISSLWERIVNWSVGLDRETDKDAGGLLERKIVDGSIEEYNSMFSEDTKELGNSKAKIGERKQKYTTMINHYYNLVTDFYEYGWGQSFHFAPRFQGETFDESIARHEHFLALRLGLRPGQKVLDVGCGVGGPARAIARLSGATVIGINNNDYQLKRMDILNRRYHLAHLVAGVKGDFMKLPFDENHFDNVYAVEATCHAPDKVGCFSQIFRVLKPGGYFAAYEWCMTDKYDAKNPEHNLIKHEIEAGDSLPDMRHYSLCVEALEKSGFEVVEHYDVAEVAPQNGNEIPWYSTLQGGWKLSQIKHSKAGRFLTQTMVDVLEFCRIAPKGTSKTHAMLSKAADYLAQGGETGIFTPMYYLLARKPEA